MKKMNVDMISYADAEALSNHLKEESKESKGYYLNYQLDIKTFDDLVAHKLLFDYQIIAFRGEKDYIVFKVSELEEIRPTLALLWANVENTQLFESVVGKIKQEYSFYGWQAIKIDLLKKQFTFENSKFIAEVVNGEPYILHSNETDNDRYCYELKLDKE